MKNYITDMQHGFGVRIPHSVYERVLAEAEAEIHYEKLPNIGLWYTIGSFIGDYIEVFTEEGFTCPRTEKAISTYLGMNVKLVYENTWVNFDDSHAPRGLLKELVKLKLPESSELIVGSAMYIFGQKQANILNEILESLEVCEKN